MSICCLYSLSLIDNTSMFVSSELSVSVVPDRSLNIILLTHNGVKIVSLNCQSLNINKVDK